MEDKEWIKFLKDRKIIAIDPGKEGGIVVFSLDKNEFLYEKKLIFEKL